MRSARRRRSATRCPEAALVPAQRRGAERRQVTVLVCGCEAFESEAYLELDAEDQAEVLRTFRQACEEAVRRSDGTIVQCNEQGLLVCFGYPVAYEDGARRAARAALGLLQDLEGFSEPLRRQHKLELNPWVGLHTGAAIVEAKEDAVSLVGEARNMAVRFEDVAAPGQVVCSEATYRLIRGQFQCTGLGPRKLKGVAQPVELFQVQGVGEGQSAIEAAGPAGLTPLTGRDHEISLLKDRWEQALEGMGQVVLLIGEPGLGKSRLVHTLKEHVLGWMVEGEVDAPVIEWRCARNTRTRVCTRPSNSTSGPSPSAARSHRRRGSTGCSTAWSSMTWPGRRLCRCGRRCCRCRRRTASPRFHCPRPGRGKRRSGSCWIGCTPAPPGGRFSSWSRTCTGSTPQPWSSSGCSSPRACTIPSSRSLPSAPSSRRRGPRSPIRAALALNRLTRRQVGELMRKKMGTATPEAVVEQIYERTAGVPLFVEEFTKLAQESGVLDQEEGDSTRVKTLMTREIPATLQDLVMARLDRMEGDREVGQLAAVIGRETSYELLAAVAEADEPALQAELGKLTQAEILYAKGRPPRCTYVFKHALLQDALYNAMVKSKRQQFHRRVAEVLEAAVPADRRDTTGTAGPPLHRGRADREGGRLLAQGGGALAGTIGGERSDRQPDPGFGAARDSARVPRAGLRGNWQSCVRWAPPTSRRAVTPPTESAPSSRGHVSCPSGWVSRHKYSPACLEAGCFTSRAAIFGGARSWPTRGWNLPTGSGTAAL